LNFFPHYTQADSKDCDATCLKIIAKYYGKTIKIQELGDYTETSRNRSNLVLISDAELEIVLKKEISK
jgi:ATP-binding cassette subfamily B protein